MPVTRVSPYLAAIAACLLCSVGQATAGAPTAPPPLTAPADAARVPPAPDAAATTLSGTWQPEGRLLLPPGISPFEVSSSTITFLGDGAFVQVVQKATGTLRWAGTYSTAVGRLTLNFWGGPVRYEFSRAGSHLLLRPVGQGKADALVLIQAPPAGLLKR